MRGLCQLVCLSVLVLGCGGSSDGPPGPLSRHFKDSDIARIPLDQQGSIVKAESDWSVSKRELAFAEANLQEADGQLRQAQNDHKAAKLAIDSAKTAKTSADQSSDMNRMNAAQKDMRGAEENERAAASRVKYFEAYRSYLKRYLRYTQENMYWREAQYENAKATLAKQNNVAPKGVVFDDYPKQVESRGKRTQSAKEKADAEKAKAVSARTVWVNQQASADKITGRTGAMYDPMQPKEGGPTMSAGGISQEKPETIKPMTSNPTPPTIPTPPANAGSGDGSAVAPQPQP